MVYDYVELMHYRTPLPLHNRLFTATKIRILWQIHTFSSHIIFGVIKNSRRAKLLPPIVAHSNIEAIH